MRLAALLIVMACGGGGGAKMPDAAVVDAPATDAGPAVNALGQLCPFAAGGGGMMCPAGNTCVKITNVGTNANTGFCTPACMAKDVLCSTGYTGPAGGVPKCILTPMTNAPATGCAIVCTTMAQCPTGLSCVSANATTKVCVPT